MTLHKVFAIHPLHLGRSRQVERGLSALLGREQERLGQLHRPGGRADHPRRKISGSDTWMQRVHGDPSSLKSMSQFIRPEQQRQLRLIIISQIGILFLALQVVKFNGGIGVLRGTDIDNARWRTRLQSIEQQLGKQKRGQVMTASVASKPSEVSVRVGYAQPALFTRRCKW